MQGATFLRADLHVHTHPDSAENPSPDLGAYIQAAIESGIDVLAITDHNRVDFVRPAIAAAAGTGLLVLPGIEISTHDGHLLAIFDPADVEALEAFAQRENLGLRQVPGSTTDLRTNRSMLSLVEEIDQRGGLAIPAHIDADHGAATRLQPAELTELLSSPALAGLEFATKEALKTWFKDDDVDDVRRAAWNARERVPELAQRGLARLMSSDAHSPDKVGRDRASRTLTRLRLDDPNFTAVQNAIRHNPKARCKAETILPADYPHLVKASFQGGFLDGVTVDFSSNLTCLIGGRGSGKSTALLAVRAALGARRPEGDDVDDPDRMPEVTTVEFVDATGATRTAMRRRGEQPLDENGAPIHLRLADLGQEESARIAGGYRTEPTRMLDFLDGFLVRHQFNEAEEALLEQLRENESAVNNAAGIAKQIQEFEAQERRLDASLKAASDGRVDDVARWALQLSSQEPYLRALRNALAKSVDLPVPAGFDLDQQAANFNVDVAHATAAKHLDGEDGLRAALAAFEQERGAILANAKAALEEAAKGSTAVLDSWSAEHAELDARKNEAITKLTQQGLKVQVGAVNELSRALAEVRGKLVPLRARSNEYSDALKLRLDLLSKLRDNRERLFQTRKKVLSDIASEASAQSDGLAIRVRFVREGLRDPWATWLGETFKLRAPRVGRAAAAITPRQFAELVVSSGGKQQLAQVLDPENGTPFFPADQLERSWKWNEIFPLEVMRCEDRPRIETQRDGDTRRRTFEHLSAGQQHSVLLGLLLCGTRREPLILDQPEDHLDGQYISQSVVRHLEGAKESRQIIIATHSANLTVLGDAELVVPMAATGGHGAPHDTGAVDRPETRDRVCDILEGGRTAYQKRGHRYGLRFANS